MDQNAKSLVKLLTQHNLTLATCESLTSGKLASTITTVPGASLVLKGGLVVYSNEAKINLAQVSQLTVEKYGVVSAECAREMARNIQQLLKVDIAISLTGNAGPQAMEGKPVGLVFIGLAIREKLIVKSYRFSGSRLEVCQQVIDKAIKLIRDNSLLLIEQLESISS